MKTSVSFLRDGPFGGRRDAPDICRRCAALKTACCAALPGPDRLLPPISVRERSRIVARLPEARYGEIIVRVENSPRFTRYLNQMFPWSRGAIAALFPVQGHHYRLSADSSGRCALLTEEGCALDEISRPLFCRLFPFWFEAGDLITHPKADCLALQECRSFSELFWAFRTSRADLERLHHQLCLEWGLPETWRFWPDRAVAPSGAQGTPPWLIAALASPIPGLPGGRRYQT